MDRCLRVPGTTDAQAMKADLHPSFFFTCSSVKDRKECHDCFS
jgi:hypothetical protein